ncbi:uncharacterized protein ATNIH1004_008000 [Aspergillus tanneri]|uniref:Uncharacterized protein n=1 Tax=Aspergillus tanneri TaxID=1220188 RepID=A0A5M9MVS0_9EURO|nr:uncharacterized protein ATNIH1004_008000 [Aspergillus tanneri]KAA8646567.1 hypothetical protein ATNIH1004_008000 [Aspergillus tanneri]
MQDQFRQISIQDFNQMIKNIEVPEESMSPPSQQEEQVVGYFDSLDFLVDMAQSAMDLAEEIGQKDAEDLVYPTPPETPEYLQPASLLAIGSPARSNQESSHLAAWKASFLAAPLIQPKRPGERTTKAQSERLLRQPEKDLHHRDLPPKPVHHRDLINHPLGEQFKQAEKDHLKGHEDMCTWQEISRHNPKCKGRQILDCKWVYAYKFD